MNEHIEQPLVSVITVVYNSAKTLEQTILSVVNQSYKNIEYIIIDGGSNDGSVEIIKKYARHIKYWVSEKDNGIYFAMNKGLNQATGEVIAILNSDDWYEPTAVEDVISVWRLNPTTEIFHGLLRFISVDNKAGSISGHHSDFLDRGMIEHPTCFIKRSLYAKVGVFNVNYRSAADYEWMLRARNIGANFLLISTLLTNFRLGGMSDSSHGFLEELKIKRRFGLISKWKYLYWFIFTKFKF